MAKHADKFLAGAFRSITPPRPCTIPAIRMMQTGRLFTGRPSSNPARPACGAHLPQGPARRGCQATFLVPRAQLAGPAANLPHGPDGRAIFGKQHDPFVLNADPVRPEIQGAGTCCRPITSRASAPSERQKPARNAVDGAVASLREEPAGEATR